MSDADRRGRRPAAAGLPLGDEDLLDILEEAIADERAAQEKYRRGLERCADPAACALFEQLLREERAHEKALEARYVEVKKRIGLHGAGRSLRSPRLRAERASDRAPPSPSRPAARNISHRLGTRPLTEPERGVSFSCAFTVKTSERVSRQGDKDRCYSHQHRGPSKAAPPLQAPPSL